MNQPGKIFGRKIAAGNNKVDFPEQVGAIPPVQHRFNHIGDR
jgi:hypothetical protein